MNTQTIAPTIDRTPKYTPISKIIKAVKKTGSVSDAAKILGLSRTTIYERFKRQEIDIEEFTDYSEDKGLSHEIMQYRIAKSLSTGDIKKMPAGSKVLAICQLNDKIRDERGKNTNDNRVLVNVIVGANSKLHTKLAKPVDNCIESVDK
jgi:hypothetical protein